MSSSDSYRLHWHQSLQFKLVVVFALVLALLGAAGFSLSRILVQRSLVEESYRFEALSSIGLGHELQAIFKQSEALGAAIVHQKRSSLGSTDGLLALLKSYPTPEAVVSVGVWSLDGSGQLWRQNKSREWQVESDKAPGDTWLAFSQQLPSGKMAWLPADMNKNAQQILGVLPIRVGGNQVGAVTISLSLDLLQANLKAFTVGRTGYALLFDQNGQLLAGTHKELSVQGKARSLKSLSESQPSLKPLFDFMQSTREARLKEGIRAPSYRAEQVSAFRKAARFITRDEAEALLIDLWAKTTAAEPSRFDLSEEALLQGPALATVLPLFQPTLYLATIHPIGEGFSGIEYLTRQTLILTLGMLMVGLVLIFGVVRFWVLKPLGHMTEQLSSGDPSQVVLDASRRDEIGALAHWHNERANLVKDGAEAILLCQTRLDVATQGNRQVSDQLQATQEHLDVLSQSLREALLYVNAKGFIERINGATELFLSTTARELINRPAVDLIPLEEKNSEGLLQRWEAFDKNLLSGQRFDRKDLWLNQRLVHLRISPIAVKGQFKAAMVLLSEASDMVVVETTPKNTSQDPLTNLPTRTPCERRLKTLLEAGGGHALIYLDIDHLRRINDLCGAKAGDEGLIRVTEILSRALPDGANLFRLGGDEFAAVLENTQESKAAEIAEELRQALSHSRFMWESRTLNLTASIGVCLFTPEIGSAHIILRRGDDAAFAAKQAGRNNVKIYEASLDRSLDYIDDELWVNRIQRGLQDNLFHLTTQRIQPEKGMAMEGLVFEILTALEDEEGFWATPGLFLAVAERHGLTGAIDRWVVREALMHLTNHPSDLARLAFCTINIATSTIGDPEFLDYLVEMFDRYASVPMNRICFELREEVVVEHPQQTIDFCQTVHSIGCRIAIDHFVGRRISDLTVLRQLPIDFLKLDAQQFKGLLTDPIEQMVAESTLRVTQHLRKRVIICNIDDEATLDTWRRLGADYLQGYVISKPSPVVFYA
jgi:diguanylate cyclase (GGDEF)-like protein